jgi:predicted flap endonuclease-1-like 5' DNA nuclease
MSKILSPKAWYLVGIGAAALALDAGRRWVTKRRREAEQAVDHGTEIPMMAYEPPKPEPVVKPTEAPKPDATVMPTRTPASKKEVAKPDDLTAIKGIGPTFARRLAEAGVTTYAALADATPEHLREITKAPPMAEPDEWIAQARQMA